MKSAALVAGQHRHRAAIELGWETISAQVLEVDDISAELSMIAENLHRGELTALERSEQIDRWRELIKERGGKGFPPSGGEQPNDTGVKKTSRELGIAPVEVRVARSISGLSDEAKIAARKAGPLTRGYVDLSLGFLGFGGGGGLWTQALL